MRTEVARIQRRFGTTTVYVTHDQTEAMTLGDRVAVMRAGVVLQVDEPGVLYRDPANLFVAGFIGSPAMNFLPGRLDGDTLQLPFGSMPVPDAIRARPSAAQELVVGVRPEHFADAALERDLPGLRFTAVPSLVESMGSDLYVHFDVRAQRIDAHDLAELAGDVEVDALPRDEPRVVARLDPASRARIDTPLDLVLRTDRLLLFDPSDGLRIR